MTSTPSLQASGQDWVSVCASDDLNPNIGICALLDNQQVAIFRLPNVDTLFAIDNHDPFSKANVLSRGLVGDLKGQYVVASPIYKQHFNLETGACLEDESVTLRTYEVREQDGQIEVKL